MFLKLLFSSVVVKVLSAIISFAMTMVITRQLGVSESSPFFLAFACIFVVGTLSRLGYDNLILKSVSAVPNDVDYHQIIYGVIWRVIARFSAFLSIILCLVALTVKLIGFVQWGNILMSVGLTAFPFAVFMSHSFFFQGENKVFIAGLIFGALFPFFIIISYYLLDVSNSTESLVVLPIAAFMSMFFCFVVRVSYAFRKFSIFGDHGRYDFSESSVFLQLACFQLIILWSGQLSLGFFNSDEVSAFSVSQRTSLLIAFVLLAVNTVAAPKISDLYHNYPIDRLATFLQRITLVLTLLSTPVVLIFLVFSAEILSIFGAEFAKYSLPLIVLCLAQFVNCVSGPVGYTLNMTGHQRMYRTALIVGVIICVILNLILVPVYGVLGAAIACSLGEIAINTVSVFAVKKKLGINIFRKIYTRSF